MFLLDKLCLISFFLGQKFIFLPQKLREEEGGGTPDPRHRFGGGYPDTLPPFRSRNTPWPPAAARGQDVTYVEDRYLQGVESDGFSNLHASPLQAALPAAPGEPRGPHTSLRAL